VQTILCYLG